MSCNSGKLWGLSWLWFWASRQALILAHTGKQTQTGTHIHRQTHTLAHWQLNCILICWIWRVADRHSRAGQNIVDKQEVRGGKARRGKEVQTVRCQVQDTQFIVPVVRRNCHTSLALCDPVAETCFCSASYRLGTAGRASSRHTQLFPLYNPLCSFCPLWSEIENQVDHVPDRSIWMEFEYSNECKSIQNTLSQQNAAKRRKFNQHA